EADRSRANGANAGRSRGVVRSAPPRERPCRTDAARDSEPRYSAPWLAASAARERAIDRGDEPRTAHGGAGGTFSRGFVLPVKLDSDSHPVAGGAARRHSPADAVFPEEI